MPPEVAGVLDSTEVARTAETIAAAAVLPCIRKTEYRDEELPSDLAGEDIGSYQSIDCILLRYVIEYQDVVREQE